MIENDIRILVWKAEDSKEKSAEGWLRTLLSRSITFFTGMPYTHAALYIDGYVFEATVWKEGRKWYHGAKKTTWKVTLLEPPARYYYPKEITNMQKATILMLAENTLGKVPYNFLQLLAFMFIYPTKWFWMKLGWVPFSAELFGATCAVYVDELFDTVHYDIFPDRISDLVVPGDYVFMHSNLEETEPLLL